jgi:YkoP-like protein
MSPVDQLVDRIRLRAPVTPARKGEAKPRDWLGRFFRSIDVILRRAMRIEQFCSDPRCVIRVRRITAAHAVHLSDGTVVRRGDAVSELHLWNEQLPRIPATGPGFAWAVAMQRAYAHSLSQLARHVAEHGAFADVDAFCAAIAFAGPWSRAEKVARAAARKGFELVDPKPSLAANLAALADGIFILCLIRAFNPAALRKRQVTRRRYEIWISKRRLLECHLEYTHSESHAPP